MTPSINSPIKSGVRVSNGPLCPHIESYRGKLDELGYRPSHIKSHLQTFAKFDLWLKRRRRPGLLWRLDERDVSEFLDQLRRELPSLFCGAPIVLRLLLAHLRDRGVVSPQRKPPTRTSGECLATEYRVFLKEERGLDKATIYNYSKHIDRFLAEKFGSARANLRALEVSDITSFVRRHAPKHGRGWAAQMVTGLRSFFRFAQFQGLIKSDLAAVVPAVANWETSGPPKYLLIDAVQRVLTACDRSTVRGKRDYAILLLLARLGLRAGEIVALKLDDFDWANGELTVRSKKGDGWARLPLPVDVGQALEQYLVVRPVSSHRNVFVRDYAPYSPFVASGPVSVLVRQAIERAGVKSSRTGAHVLRHSLATNMLSRGASLAEIGQVLRHRDPNSTAIYARVNLSALCELAMPWPGGGQ